MIEAHHRQVLPNTYQVKPVFSHWVRKFSEGYVPEDQFLMNKTLLL
jgi:hypothetical protein